MSRILYCGIVMSKVSKVNCRVEVFLGAGDSVHCGVAVAENVRNASPEVLRSGKLCRRN